MAFWWPEYWGLEKLLFFPPKHWKSFSLRKSNLSPHCRLEAEYSCLLYVKMTSCAYLSEARPGCTEVCPRGSQCSELYFLCVSFQFNYTHAASSLFIITLIHFNIHFSWLSIEKNAFIIWTASHLWCLMSLPNWRLCCKRAVIQRRWAWGKGASQFAHCSEFESISMTWDRERIKQARWGIWGPGASSEEWDWQCICLCSVLNLEGE